MSHKTFLITGATGKTGRRVVSLLHDAGHDVRAASRSTDPAFDWEDQSTWPAALDGVGAVYIVTPALYDPATEAVFRSFGTLAVEAGVTRAVMVSVPDDGNPSFGQVKNLERQLVETGLDLTVLRLRWFNQNFSEDFLAPAVLAGDLRLPAGQGAEAFVDADDIAAVAVAALTDEAHSGRDYDLTGPRVMTFADVARDISEATGHQVRYTPMSKEDFLAEQLASHVPAEWAEFAADLYDGIASGALASTSTDVQDVLGRPARDFRDYAADVAASGAWAPGESADQTA